MWWDYFLFFSYNFLSFLVAMVLWKILPKAKPYDYTTIPGLKLDNPLDNPDLELKPDWISDNNFASFRGHMGDISIYPKFQDFVRFLHKDFGALASFYWGARYTVSLCSWDHFTELWKFKNSVETKSGWSVRDVLLGREVRTGFDLKDNEIVDLWNSSLSEGITLSSRVEKLVKDLYKLNTLTRSADFKFIAEQYKNSQDQSLTTAPSSQKKNESSQVLEQQFRALFLCKVLQRVLTEAADKNDSQYSRKVYAALADTIPPLTAFSFNVEIEINGYPIPKTVPIIVCTGQLCSLSRTNLKDFVYDRRVEALSMIPDVAVALKLVTLLS